MKEPISQTIDLLTIPQLLLKSKQKLGTSIAIRFYDGAKFQTLTYNDFYQAIMQATSALCHAGIRFGDKVAILSENRPQWGEAYFAGLFLGAVNVPLDTSLKPQELPYIIRHSGARVVVVSGKFLSEIDAIQDNNDLFDAIITMDQSGDHPFLFEDDNPPAIDAPAPAINDLATIVYTSGTTGLAKGVMLSHGNISSDIRGILDVISLSPSDKFISILPRTTCMNVSPDF
jgi:long-chain acyl-CoA synthetase